LGWEGASVKFHDDCGDINFDLVLGIVVDALVAGAMAELEGPHLVICRDPETHLLTFAGPYADGMAAMCAAEQDLLHDRTQFPESRLEFSVAPLLAPMDLDTQTGSPT
jgi:hypothetical protein